MRQGLEACVNDPDYSARLLPLPALLRCLTLAAFLCLTPGLLAPALAEPIRVSAAADPGSEPLLARQQAQDRAFVEAVFQTAQRILPTPLVAPRAELLRRFLTPRATALVQSFQEVAPAKPLASAPVEKTPAAKPGVESDQVLQPPVTLEMDVEVNRAAISTLLSRLGLLAGSRHPKVFALRLGQGVAEADLKPLSDLLALQGLARMAQAPVQVTLERVPQGYLKAVLYAGANSFVTDSQDMTLLWLDLWGKYFSAREQQPGGAGSPIEVSGFSHVDEVLEFTKTLASWDDCLREVRLDVVDMRSGNSTGRWTARLTSPERLDARLREYLPGRKLTAVR
ncbi:MAG: hypothetical protein CVU73_01215 [Deltaproteobacteria bacterium HGW-Deltaproteobacteria-8]|jgi:hypothetical protein|nr:MAG: hypothetical protein CVU73_01215 [Deltaproteobacteria bacterium HGW-Deltaproteobacteria-8]